MFPHAIACRGALQETVSTLKSLAWCPARVRHSTNVEFQAIKGQRHDVMSYVSIFPLIITKLVFKLKCLLFCIINTPPLCSLGRDGALGLQSVWGSFISGEDEIRRLLIQDKACLIWRRISVFSTGWVGVNILTSIYSWCNVTPCILLFFFRQQVHCHTYM